MIILLLNYVTLTIATILFLVLVSLLIFKHRQISKTQKRIIYLLCALIVIYFFFIAILTFAFENTHPGGGPLPVF